MTRYTWWFPIAIYGAMLVAGSLATNWVDGFSYPIFVFAPIVLALWTAGALFLVAAASRRSPTCLVAALLLIATPICLLFAGPTYTYPGDRLRFLRELPMYEQKVAGLPQDGRRFAEFNWGGMLFASFGVIYDETDEVVRRHGQQSPEWKRRMTNTDLTCGTDGPIGQVEPMGGHFYLTTFGC